MSAFDILRQSPIFADLPATDLVNLAEKLDQRTFARGMIIFHKGSIGQSLYLIASGRVRIFLLSETGREISLEILNPGDYFGELALLDDLPRSAGALAMERTVTYALHRDDFRRLLDAHPRLGVPMLTLMSKRLRSMINYTEHLAFTDVQGRVAAKLLALAERNIDRGGVGQDTIVVQSDILLPMTQGELATWVAASRESVNKVLGIFRDQGLIRLEGQRIVIVDKRALQLWLIAGRV